MEEIGRKLKTARTEKGYTLDDLQQITKIQKRYLIAIEEGNFSALPGDFYVRAFIKQYAETVGLSGNALLTQYQEEIPSPQPQPQQAESVEQEEKGPVRGQRAVDKPNRLRKYMPQILIGLAALVLILGSYYIMIVVSRNNRQTIGDSDVSVAESSVSVSKKKSSSKASESSKKPKPKKEEVEKKPVAVKVDPSQTTVQTATVSDLPTGENKLIVGAANGSAWMAIRVNGQTVYQGTMNNGQKQELKLPANVENFAVQTGNASATTIKLNDTNVDLSSGTRIVRTINFTVQKAAATEGTEE